MIIASAEQAAVLVQELLDTSGGRGPAGLVITHLRLHELGWVAWYTSAEYIESRSFVHLLGGNIPVVVIGDEARFVRPEDVDTVLGAEI